MYLEWTERRQTEDRGVKALISSCCTPLLRNQHLQQDRHIIHRPHHQDASAQIQTIYRERSATHQTHTTVVVSFSMK